MNVRAYYATLVSNYIYSDEAYEVLNGYVASAIDAINAATSVDEVEIAFTEFQINVDEVERTEKTPSKTDKKNGCGSVVGSGLAMSGVALAAAAIVVARKKKED